MPQKNKTRDQVTAMQEKAVRFLRDVKGDEDAADEFEAMSPEEYAEHKHLNLVENPCSGGTQITIRRITTVAKQPTLAELKAQIEDLQTENEDLQAENDELNDKIDSIMDLASDEDDEDDDDSDDDDIDDEDDDL